MRHALRAARRGCVSFVGKPDGRLGFTHASLLEAVHPSGNKLWRCGGDNFLDETHRSSEVNRSFPQFQTTISRAVPHAPAGTWSLNVEWRTTGDFTATRWGADIEIQWRYGAGAIRKGPHLPVPSRAMNGNTAWVANLFVYSFPSRELSQAARNRNRSGS